ncbi:MAG: ABC transporter ATP-binding protein [Clostridiales bacterium]|nr:ABC transporter ATP-binding protein [Clostridiales bacterium]
MSEQAVEQAPVSITAENIHLSYRSIVPVSMQGKKKAAPTGKPTAASNDEASGISANVLSSFSRKGRVEHFEALHGVSFEIHRGEIVGLVGKNGSGKSTLLRVLAGIFEPDEGRVDLHGSTVSLLALGVGFLKQLSGRDNIYLSAMLLGFSKEQIDAQIDEIIEFSELGDFIERPVKTYSSGMVSKLSFSITAILKTDIILVDEVLSVGDAKFRKKSLNKMLELISEKSRTVVIVSHDAKTIQRLCTSVIWLHDGDIRMIGPTKKVMPAYRKFMDDEE